MVIRLILDKLKVMVELDNHRQLEIQVWSWGDIHFWPYAFVSNQYLCIKALKVNESIQESMSYKRWTQNESHEEDWEGTMVEVKKEGEKRGLAEGQRSASAVRKRSRGPNSIKHLLFFLCDSLNLSTPHHDCNLSVSNKVYYLVWLILLLILYI